ncbi:MAG: S1 RNA-binding domain-containing protein [Oscillospiraceae bacterium]|nr:S1 RNA-binding domain-containing protein [Oscillospiraceae bacterium]
MQLEVGTVLEGRVTGITKFGAFVSLPGGKSGLVHISEVANSYVSDVHEYLSEGQNVKVKVIAFTPEGKINLSIKKAAEPPPAPPRRESRPAPRRDSAPRSPLSGEVYETTGNVSFGNKLKQFMQESDSKMSGSRMYDQQRRGTRRRK